MLRDRLEEIEAQTEKDKEWWEKRRSNIKSDFMKELEEESGQAKAGSEDEPVLVDTDTPSATPSGASKKNKK
jgi:translocation protein SEC66